MDEQAVKPDDTDVVDPASEPRTRRLGRLNPREPFPIYAFADRPLLIIWMDRDGEILAMDTVAYGVTR